jgi:hypothetical protein
MMPCILPELRLKKISSAAIFEIPSEKKEDSHEHGGMGGMPGMY